MHHNSRTLPPTPSSTDAPASRPARPTHWLFRLPAVRRACERIRHGHLDLTLPDGSTAVLGGALPGPKAALHLHRWRPLLRLAMEGDLGLAFSFRDGDWTTPDLTELLSFGIANESALSSQGRARGPARWLGLLLHRAKANTRRRSRDNISAHYDLGNRFYEQWLDSTMLYSSAVFEADGAPLAATLEEAQERRLERIVSLLDASKGQRVLEIGCGWGTLAATLAKRCDAEVVGLTLSTEQLAFAQARARDWQVQDRVDLRLQDYRDVDGQFDRIVSIEMIEAVGEAFWPVYFQTLKNRLKPGGSAVIQAITIDEAHFEAYRSSPDFIQRCIFPGGMLPTPERMAAHARQVGLSFSTDLRFGRDYARTLAEWRHRFLAQWPSIEALGFDLPFKRIWEYYLCYCEAGFLAGRVDVGLYRLERPAD
ncbi:SAM-dependent methyltransferase [Roseateles terrae]|uniref:Cyclopropane-fatty-acyl-phospholipid synthase n=1 Tax=Roseateles terrae TaxID=431060 RepID=A0ABR6GN25_9BURK|nr:cyclopropane-fatty-acyl-phospholipid synthase family protein [Roseateles terrae]MBB3193092.1 cyclopropane-fatty-acyl-phospholipid synthase [Roseateles terrae]OWQ89674.1 SAM-dependent methyltransferase [Roseateles terrae]